VPVPLGVLALLIDSVAKALLTGVAVLVKEPNGDEELLGVSGALAV
jgi:hypothetical protein